MPDFDLPTAPDDLSNLHPASTTVSTVFLRSRTFLLWVEAQGPAYFMREGSTCTGVKADVHALASSRHAPPSQRNVPSP